MPKADETKSDSASVKKKVGTAKELAQNKPSANLDLTKKK